MFRPTQALALAALLAGCTSSLERAGFRHLQGPYPVEVSYPRWVSGPHLPVDVTMTNAGGPTVVQGMPEEDAGCGLTAAPLRNVVTGQRVMPLPEPGQRGCLTDALVLSLEPGQTVEHRFWYSMRGVPAGAYTLPLNLPSEFGKHEIEVQVRH